MSRGSCADADCLHVARDYRGPYQLSRLPPPAEHGRWRIAIVRARFNVRVRFNVSVVPVYCTCHVCTLWLDHVGRLYSLLVRVVRQRVGTSGERNRGGGGITPLGPRYLVQFFTMDDIEKVEKRFTLGIHYTKL